MTIFAMKGHAGPLFHGSHSTKPLEIRGSFHCSGPQPVEDDGCPQWVADIFDRLPGLERIALDGNGRGAVWSRMLPDNAMYPAMSCRISWQLQPKKLAFSTSHLNSLLH